MMILGMICMISLHVDNDHCSLDTLALLLFWWGCPAIQTIADTSRLGEDSYGADTGVSYVGHIRHDLAALIWHGSLAAVDEEVQVTVGHICVLGEENAVASDAVVAGIQAGRERVAGEGP